MNDPEVLEWLDTREGQEWLNERHQRKDGFFSIKEQKGVYCSPFSWGPLPDGQIVKVNNPFCDNWETAVHEAEATSVPFP